MDDFSQPRAAALQDQPSRNGKRLRAPDAGPRVSFPELVLAHFEWRQAAEAGAVTEKLEERYLTKLRRFEDEHGQIVNSYWCLDVPSAVALTEKSRSGLLRRFGRRPSLRFHRVTDWATRDKPAIAAGLHFCDVIAIKAEQVLTGLRQRIALNLVMASAAHLLSRADGQAAERGNRKLDEQHRRYLSECHAYYCDAANGQTQMIYFAGMGVFALLLGALAIPSGFLDPLPQIDDREFFGALLAGALGAVVSVVARINSGRFDLEYDVGRFYPFFLGGLRPLMGGIFGLGVYFAVSSGLLDVTKAANSDPFYAIVAVAFAAGFSERFAKDTLAVATATPQPKPRPGSTAALDLPAKEDSPATKPALEPGP
jgi:hypothetical protein